MSARASIQSMPSGAEGIPATDHAAERLVPLVYNELRNLARRYMGRERGYQTLQPTALVHETYLRLLGLDRIRWRGKTHFLAIAATQMRRILVERARAARAQKRGANGRKLVFHEHLAVTAEPSIEILALDEALRRLTRKNPRRARVAELRLFAGMPMAELARTTGVSERTVKEDWRMARAWLARELRSTRRERS